MLAGAAELGLARGKLHSPYWRLTSSLALVVSGTAFLVHEQNHWLFSRAAFLHHVLGWTALVARRLPARARVPPALDRRRVRLRDDRSSRSPCSSTATATSRRSSGTSRSRGAAAPMRRRSSSPAARRARASGGGVRARVARSTSRRRSSSELARSPRQVVLQFDQSVDALPNGDPACSRRTARTSPARRARSRRSATIVALAAEAADGRVHGALAGAVERRRTSSRASTRSASRVPAPPVTDAVGAQGPTRDRARRALAVLPRARAPRRRARLPAARRARAAAAARSSGASSG